MKKMYLLKTRVENKIIRYMLKEDKGGLNTLMVEAGLAIVGIVLLLILSDKGSDYLTQVIQKCLDKSLAILTA